MKNSACQLSLGACKVEVIVRLTAFKATNTKVFRVLHLGNSCNKSTQSIAHASLIILRVVRES